MEEKVLPEFDDYMEEFGKENLERRGEKLEDISSLPELEKTLLNKCKVPVEYWPQKFDHFYRNIKIARDGEEHVSVEDAVKLYREKR